MRLSIEALEPRDTPAAVSLGNGELRLSSGVGVHPFGDWTGTYSTLEAGDLTYVAGTAGAGPRVAVFHPDGSRAGNDYFADDPATRYGVVFVGVGPTPPPAFAPESVGAGYALYVDADRSVRVDTAAVVDAVARYFGGVADVVRVTNVRPDLTPGSYLDLVVDGSGGTWQGSGVVGRATLGSVAAANPGFGVKLGVATGSSDFTEPGAVAAVLAHEAGHGFGLPHVLDPRDLMYPTVGGAQAFSADELAQIRAAALAGLSAVQEHLP